MENKILTVSISAYNVERYIKDTLDSLILPNISDVMEVLIINDGSTDNTTMIVEQYVKKYPHIFNLINKENGGYGSTINTSLKLAKGKYFKQLDGDDWFEKDNLGAFINFLKETDADCIYSPYWKVYQNTGNRILKTAVNLDKNVINVRDISMHALTFKTKIFTENNIEITEHCFYTDCEYNIKPLIFSKTIEYFCQPIYCYRLEVSGQSVSKEGWKKHYNDHNQVSLEIMSYYECNKDKAPCLYKNTIEKYISKLYKTNFYVALETDDKKIQTKYKEFDLVVKEKFKTIYSTKNFKMKLLTSSRYKIWWIIKIIHNFFKKK